MELDTGAAASLMPEDAYYQMEHNLCTYSEEKLKVLGSMKATVCYEEQQITLPWLVIKGSRPSLLEQTQTNTQTQVPTHRHRHRHTHIHTHTIEETIEASHLLMMLPRGVYILLINQCQGWVVVHQCLTISWVRLNQQWQVLQIKGFSKDSAITYWGRPLWQINFHLIRSWASVYHEVSGITCSKLNKNSWFGAKVQEEISHLCRKHHSYMCTAILKNFTKFCKKYSRTF